MTEKGLVFKFEELVWECEVIKSFAKDFLDPKTTAVIDQARAQLQAIQTQGATNNAVRWSIPKSRPLSTRVSEGESQPNNKSLHLIRADFSFVWQIRPLDAKPWPSRKHFALDGLASSVVSLMNTDDECIARWTVEVGDQQSPGTHFHTQVKSYGAGPGPQSLDIPRLPALPMSPFLVLEFAIGELFQDAWRIHAAEDSPDSRRWRTIHAPRLVNFFRWQQQCLGTGSVGSPWAQLKRAKPNADALVKGA